MTLSHASAVPEDDPPIGRYSGGDPDAIVLGSTSLNKTSSRKLREPVPERSGTRTVRTDVQTIVCSDQEVPEALRAGFERQSDGFPYTIRGLNVKTALNHVPPLPVQESNRVLWMLVACWLGSANVGSPKQSLRAMLLALRDLLNMQLTVPTAWVGLTPGLLCPASVQLCAEFGPVEFIRACLGVSSFFILLHHDSNVRSLYPLFCEVDALFAQWCEQLGCRHWEC